MTSYRQADSASMKLRNALAKVDLRTLKPGTFENFADYYAAVSDVMQVVSSVILEGTNSTDLSQKDFSSQPMSSTEENMTSYTQADSLSMKLRNSLSKVDLRTLKPGTFKNFTEYNAAFIAVMQEVSSLILEGSNSTDLCQKDLSSQPMSRTEDAEQKVAREVVSILSSDSLLAAKHADIPVPELNPEECLQKVSKINSTEELVSLCKGLANHLNVVPEKISCVTSIHDDLEGKFMSAKLNGENSQSSFMAEDLVPLTASNDFPAFVLPALEEPDQNLVSEKIVESQGVPCFALSGMELEDLNVVSDSVLPFDVNNKKPGNGKAFLPRQTRKIKVLELSIEEARTIKQTLISSLEAIRNTMRKVEEREKTAGKAEEEATEVGQRSLSRAEELKTMMEKSNKLLDKHAGEVYGERSILFTEASEIQSRLATIKEERDKALSILDKMHHSVELRLNVADEEIRKVTEEKLNEEDSIEKHFSDQEVMVDKIVQELKVLELEAEENLMLRAFLVARGRTVDTLQREMAAICQAVNSRKCRFDEWVPLGESVSSPTMSERSISSQALSEQQVEDVPAKPSSPAKQLTDSDEDDWEFV